MARADAASATSCFPWPPPASPGRVDECPGVVPIRPTSLTLPLLPLSPFPTSPNTLAAADELPRGHRPPLASPMRSKAPPRPPPSSPPTHGPPEALQRRHHRRSVAGHRSSPPSIRDVWRIPEPTEPPCCPPVSLPSFPLTSLSRARPVAAAPRAPEAAVRHGRRAPCPEHLCLA